ncbi:hypothetical protein RHGRI_033534 [Rhododendron griersonianum]|uniref:Uncharacterized protein n=1 Tax=Rhododendron griersonianum TaxID=479676 RepID=A0AAV6HXP4_9ERIC|nr:hypothetical protein RHGRI_033534 [Rhododendron griersonianum]
MLYEEYQRNLEFKRLSRDNLELSYSFSSNKNYTVAATKNSRDTSLRLLGPSQSSFEGQQTDKDLSISDSSRSNNYDGYEIAEKEGDRVELEEVIFVEPNIEETVEVNVECSHCGHIEADGKEKFDIGISEKEETIIEVDNKKIGIDVGDQVVDDQNFCPLEVVDTNISVNEEILVSDIGESKLLSEKIDSKDLANNHVEAYIHGKDSNHDCRQSRINDANFVDFLGVQQFDWVPNIRLVHLVNKLKYEEKRSLHEYFSLNNFWKTSKRLKYSKYLFLWNGRWQISNENSRARSFEENETDVGQDWRIYIFYFYLR